MVEQNHCFDNCRRVRERFVIVASAALVRLFCLALFDPSASRETGDSASFLAGSAEQAPGYSAFLAIAPFPLAIQSIATVLVALLAHARLPRSGILAALLFAASPFLTVFEYRILSDSLGWQLVFAAFLLIMFPRSKWEVLLAGVMLGCAALIRDTYQWLPLFAIPFALANWKRMGAAALVAYLVILPWQVSQGRIAISQGRMGMNLWIGTWERNSNWLANGLERAEYPPEAFANSEQRRWLLEQPLFTPSSDHRFRRAAIDRITSEPLATAATWTFRYPRLWLGTRSDQIAWRIAPGSLWYAAKASLWALNLMILLLGAAGMLLCWRLHPLFIAPILYVAIIYIPFHNTEPRYSLGALPFLMIFAAQAIRLAADQPVSRRAVQIVNQRLHPFRQLRQGNGRRIER
jgi:hypothetical protein